MKIRLLIFLSLSIFTLDCIAQDSILSIIPRPEFVKINSGKFILNAKTKICVNSKDKGFLDAAEFFKSIVKKGTLMNLQIVENSKVKNEPNTIYLNNYNQSAAMSNEGYILNVNSKNIEISAITSTGIFYGLQSLRQMLPPEIEGNGNFLESVIWEIPCAQIIDKPRFGWRGMLLDCCRHFMDKEFVLRYLDLLAYYKMNRFHWHLTEDQGWRIEIKKYPKLTEIGAWRKEEDGSTYGGFYTQADIKEVVAYAEKLHIMVIPEIEMPGHAVAALAAYPQFSCTQQPITVENNWGVFKDIYCAGNDSTFKFIEDVLTEVISLFPGPYIHIGGDEAPKYRWENCPKCQNRMKVEGLKNEGELQSYFVTRIEKFLSSKNKKLIGWDEILEGGLAPNATVQSWQGVSGAISAVNSGHDAIVSPTSHAYFDYPLKSIDLKKVYKFDPVPDGISKENAHHILGGESNMWTEHAPQEKIDSKIFPRILAMSEVLWSPLEGKDYSAFNKRVQKNYSKLDYLGVKYGFETQPISFDVKFDEVEKAFKVALISGQKGLKMNYTTDGYKPIKSSSVYQNPINLNHSCELQASIFQGSQTEAEVFSRQLVLHKAINKKYKLTFHYHQNYSANGDNSLLDGQKGSTDFHDGLWQGFQKSDFEAVIDMGESTKITKISASFLQSMPSWIFFPEDVEYLVSEDGINFKTVAEIKNDALQNIQETKLKEFDSNFQNLQARYIKVKAKKVGVCPEWHEAAGSEAWLFIDEIVID